MNILNFGMNKAEASQLQPEGIQRQRKKNESLRNLSRILTFSTIIGGISGFNATAIFEGIRPDKKAKRIITNIGRILAETAKAKEKELSLEDIKLTGLEGFDKRISAEEIRGMLKETFPPKWLGYIKSIEQANDSPNLSEEYGEALSSAKSLASCYCWDGQTPDKKIVFHKLAKELNTAFLLQALSHEIAHAHMASMPESRIQRLKQLIAERLSSPDRFMSSYVEKIKNKDKSVESGKKTKEYWATIVENFFANPNSLHIKDFLIVANELKQSDPSFDYLKALERRRELARDTKEQDLFATISHKENPEDPNSFKITFKHKGESYEMTIPLNMPYRSFLISMSGSKLTYGRSYHFRFEDQESRRSFLELEIIPSADNNLVKVKFGLKVKTDQSGSQIVDTDNLGGTTAGGAGGQTTSGWVEEKTFVEKTLVPLFKNENKS